MSHLFPDDLIPPQTRPRTSRQRYRRFVEDYRNRRLDDLTDAARGLRAATDGDGAKENREKRRELLREYLR